MALMEYNKNPISLREGKVIVDGIEVADLVDAKFTFTPEVWTGKVVGEHTDSSRWLGYAVKGTITRRRSTNWLKLVIKKYLKNGATPEIKIQGIMNDKHSDYYAAHKNDTVTLVGVVLTGDLPLTALDSKGEVVDDKIAFNAKDVIL